MVLKHLFCFVMALGCLVNIAEPSEIKEDNNLWQPNGDVTIHMAKMNELQKAMVLDRFRMEIKYAVQNVNKSFDEIELIHLGYTHGYEWRIKIVTNGLIAEKYYKYSNYKKAAEYFYKDWQVDQECNTKKVWNSPGDCWPGGIGDYNPLFRAIGAWEDGGLYNEALKHYPEAQKELIDNYGAIMGTVAITDYFDIFKEAHPEEGQYYENFMAGWKKTKELAKTEKPKPLEPAVQNHEWFHSDKQNEVLKALEYYYKHRVKFMLEKALKHKNPVISKKAKDYLEKLVKDLKNEKVD
ncbi:MAG: hypothetical protein A2X34_01420 [Elusimicrobia bacterium GWC2_51_8]|nr:MAG: hypothetical protein A2X34_01420 [Elusimicrobia bacterium GWC2_51_8]OGR88243.1 MAG: hypothetical protein A2021_04910 [Elusimicrobia bacterium GWF2_52_66]